MGENRSTARRLEQVGGKPALLAPLQTKKPFVTDGGNYVIDCALGPIAQSKEVADHLDHVVGVVEHGLFLGFACEAIIGGREGVKFLKRK